MFKKAEFIYAAGLSAQLKESDKPEIVFSGRSNVGKSSLINKLVSRKSLARVSATPGKTATINFFDVDQFTLVDLPGYGYAKVSKSEKMRWAELVEGYFAKDRKICLVVQIVDMRHKMSADDINMIDFLYQNAIPFIVVATKKDKLNVKETNTQLEYFSNELSKYNNVPFYACSSLKGDSIEQIRQYIETSVKRFEV